MSDLDALSRDELHAQVQHRLIEELGSTELRLQRLLEILPEVAFQCDESERLTYLNEAWSTLLGHEIEDSIGAPLTSFLIEEDRPSWPGFPEPGQADREVQLRFAAQEGEERWFLITLRTTTEGEHTGLLHDITERVELEGQLRQAQKMEAVGRLAGGVAHDFNNLLTVIIGTCEGLLSSPPSDERARRDDVETVLKASDRAAKLTRQLLAFGRRQVMNCKVLSLSAVIEEMGPILDRLTGPTIEVEVDDHAGGGWVSADRTQLEQVIMNLAVNARDAMPDGGRIHFGLSEGASSDRERPLGLSPGPLVKLTVSDTGSGIEPEHLEHIFDPFYTTKKAGQGTGLGLATTHGIITQSGGAIDVESQLGEGTSFNIYLPAEARPDEAAGSAGADAASPIGHQETILLVDDNDMIRNLATRMLTDGGYSVLEAKSVSEAKRTIVEKEGGVDLVITDLVMPESSGRELKAWLALERPDVGLIMMSGLGERANEESGLFLQKPFRKGELLKMVRAAISD
ncbi:MAG: ATP-binding protein [Planctomycetes bacterium]|nr:ATP-binding protein [Planctomycetota bacterium]